MRLSSIPFNFFALVCIVAGITATPLVAQELRTIKVSGQGVVSVVPAYLQFSIEIEQRGERVQPLNYAAEQQVEQLISQLILLGVDKQDIRALAVNVRPWIEHYDRKQVNTGFQLSRQIDVKVRDLSIYPQVLDKVMLHDVNRVFGFNYFPENSEKSYMQALDLALEDAKLRAKRMASKMDLTLGEVLNIQEHSSRQSVNPTSEYRARAVSSAYQPGAMNISASVSVSFAIQ
jgi:uncharacterized protein YggE